MNGLHGESLLLILNEIANPYKSGMTIILEAFLVNGLKNYCSGSCCLWLLVLRDIIGETVP